MDKVNFEKVFATIPWKSQVGIPVLFEICCFIIIDKSSKFYQAMGILVPKSIWRKKLHKTGQLTQIKMSIWSLTIGYGSDCNFVTLKHVKNVQKSQRDMVQVREDQSVADFWIIKIAALELLFSHVDSNKKSSNDSHLSLKQVLDISCSVHAFRIQFSNRLLSQNEFWL